MTHYSNEQWLFDLSIPPNDINSQLVNHDLPEKTLLKHIDDVTKYMKKFAQETNELKTR